MTSLIDGPRSHYELGPATYSPLGQEVYDLVQDPQVSSPLKVPAIAAQLNNVKDGARRLQAATHPHRVALRTRINERFRMDHCGSDDSEIVMMLAKGSLKSLLGFSVWHVQQAQRQQYQLDMYRPQLISEVEDFTDDLIAGGVFPRQARRAFSKALDDVPPPVALDSFHAGVLGHTAAFDMNICQMAIANEFAHRPSMTGVGPDLAGTYFHEYMHAAGRLSRAGFWPLRTPEEFFVSHSTAVALHPEVDTEAFNPIERGEAKSSHQFIRALFSLALEYGPYELVSGDFGEAFFDTTEGRRAHRSFSRKLDKNIRAVVPDFHQSGIAGLESCHEEAYASPKYTSFMSQLLLRTIDELSA